MLAGFRECLLVLWKRKALRWRFRQRSFSPELGG